MFERLFISGVRQLAAVTGAVGVRLLSQGLVSAGWLLLVAALARAGVYCMECTAKA